MRRLSCAGCGAELFFASSVCLVCGLAAGYDREAGRMAVPDQHRPICANLDRCGCNWLADPASPAGLCFSCRLTRTRPADDDPAGLRGYFVAEQAKRRLVYGLDHLGLPVKPSDGYVGLAFDLLSSTHGPIVTGYSNGVITLDLAESDDASRESRRSSLGEPYRTVLGHLRHEVGHYYAELLVLTTERRETFVDVFGDETVPYDSALSTHYGTGPTEGWQRQFITAYASVHPLEDFAETFAHLLHISDGMQTAAAFGLAPELDPTLPFSRTVTKLWLPLVTGVNELDRSLGRSDLYPFVLSPEVLHKLDYVAGVVQSC